ncbi:hypothetical protein GCM10028819_22440 [Spirosoma humi]
MTELQLPVTIRTARLDEIPKNADIIKRIELRKTARIIEGYTIQLNPTNELPYTFYSEINIDNSRLWLLFKSLLLTFPEEISFIFGHIDNEPTYSEYQDKFVILNKIDGFETELTQDGYLEFGIIFHSKEILLEVFIKKAKYVQFWGVDKEVFLNIMQGYSLLEINNLNFIDEYPMVIEPLRLHNPNTKDTADLLHYFEANI